MKRTVLIAGLCLLTALSSGAQEQLILGNLDPNATEATVRATLESIAAVDEVYRINPLDDGRGISVFRATYGKEGARIQTLRRIAETGMVGYPIDAPDECTLSVYKRKDQTAVKALDTNPYLRTLQEAEEELAAAEAALIAIEVVILDIKENFEEGKGLLEMRIRMLSSAREATTRARLVHQASIATLRDSPNRVHFLAFIRATADLQTAMSAENAAAVAVKEAEALVAKFTQEFGQVQATKKERVTKVYEKQRDFDIASRALQEAWNAVGASINVDLIAAAESLARDALDLADALAHEAEHVRQSVVYYNGHSFYGAADLLKETVQALATCSALADADAGVALTLVDAAHKLPALTKESLAEVSTKAALESLFDQLEQGALAFAANSMVQSIGKVGPTPWRNLVLKALALAEAQCDTTGCDDDVAELGSELESLQQLSLQQAMQQQSQVFNTLTNVQKSKHDMQMAVIQNIR